jgi:predicted esterase YcpF (UPF0227 family)
MPGAVARAGGDRHRRSSAGQQGRPTTLVGSSLGGYYASLAGREARPACRPDQSGGDGAACSLDWSARTPTSTPARPSSSLAEHVEQLRALETPAITPERYLLLVETGDEVLDYRQAVARYAGSRQIVLEGGDHSFTRFPDLVPQIIEFCGL